jgi:hypothetical protein
MTAKGLIGAFLVTMAGNTVSQSQAQPPATLWVYDAGSMIQGSPAVTSEGVVYIGVQGGLHAVTNGGLKKWVYPLETGNHGGYSTPTLAEDGTAYISSGDLYSVNAGGSLNWTFPAGCENGAPALARDSTVYVHGLYLLDAVSKAGMLVWSNRIGGTYDFGSPVIASDMGIYISSPEVGKLYRLKEDGTREWEVPLAAKGDAIAISATGVIYVSAGGLYAIAPNGTTLWGSTNVTSPGCPSIGPDGTIYVAGIFSNSLCAFEPSGDLKWRAPIYTDGTNASPSRAPAIDSSGMIYYAVSNSLYAVTSGGAVAWTFSTGDNSNSLTSPAIGPDGTIYVTFGSTLYALYGTNKLADSAWPMYRQNARHTGKIEKASVQQPKKRAEGGFQLQVMSQIDQSFTVQTSTNLVNWLDFTNMICTNVPMDVIDPSPPVAAKFYRAYTQ